MADGEPPAAAGHRMNCIYFGDNLPVLRSLPSESVHLIYIDPPFNTGKAQTRARLQTHRDEEGDRTGFQGRRYRTVRLGEQSFVDSFGDSFLDFLEPRLVEARRVLTAHGSLYFHIDYREAHYCKILLDEVFGRECFLNEIIWAYDYGARTKKKWPAKHDNILWYAKDPDHYIFNYDQMDRIPYMAPGLVGPEKAARGKTPTDCYSADTEILTGRGWISFSDLRLTDRVASVSPAREIVYAAPTKLHHHFYQGEMCAITTRTIDLLVTPHHKLYARPKNCRDYRFIEATAANERQYYSLMNQLSWSAEGSHQYCVPPVEYKREKQAHPLPSFEMGDWCEFIGLYLAEGCTTFYRDRTEVLIAQSQQKNLRCIHDLLKKMGISYHQTKHGFIICNKQLASYLKQFGHAHEKYIPRGLLEQSPDYLSRLFDGLMLGDGNKDGNYWTYFTTSPRLANDVQELIIKLGYNSNITIMRSGNPNWRPKYCVGRRVARESTFFPTKHWRMVDYAGHVYCCTVEPHHTLIVRRSGKACVCGNCWWHTIVSPTGKERTGYPTQKPLGILTRIVRASSNPGDTVLDFFAGSGTTGAAAFQLGRNFILVDDNKQAIEVMRKRLAHVPDLELVKL